MHELNILFQIDVYSNNDVGLYHFRISCSFSPCIDQALTLDSNYSFEKSVISKMAANWFHFGIKLGLSSDMLRAIQTSDVCFNDEMRCVIMLHHWRREFGRVEDNMERVLQAMEETNSPTYHYKVYTYISNILYLN